MTVSQDEALKAACHGLVIGCLLPVFTFNVGAGNKLNQWIYGALLAFEGYQVYGHVKAAHKP